MKFDQSEAGRWYIQDWAGNHMCEGDFDRTGSMRRWRVTRLLGRSRVLAGLVGDG